MNNELNQSATPQTPTLTCSGVLREREAPLFNGTDDYDVEDWLSSFERVSTHNRWDDAMKLNNVGLSLRGVAETWYRNHERTDARTWSEFKVKFVAVFGRPAVRKLQAEQRLRSRAQKVGENFTSYIEDVVDLCRRVDTSMPEAEKIKHILKGIDDDAFQMLLSKDLRTVDDVVNLCQSFDELRRQRALTRGSHARDDSGLSMAAISPDSSFLGRIKEFVREEVARQLSLLPSVTKSVSTLEPALKDVIRDQIAEALPPPPQYVPLAAPLTYAEVAARPLPESALTFQPTYPVRPRAMPPVLPRPQFTPQTRSAWRTPDNRPICFACGIPGHVARYCRRRPPSTWESAQAAFPPSPQFQGMPRSPDQCSQHLTRSPDRATSTDHRLQSPRRRSLSPMRRRPVPGDTEN